jgi:uncharacterized membrane protein
MQWWYADDNKPVGPISDEEFQALVTAGKIGAQTLVWHEGMENWQPYCQVAPGAAGAPAEAAAPAEAPAPSAPVGQMANRDIMAEARASLSGLWGLAIAVVVVAQIISMATAFVPAAGNIVAVLIAGPMALGSVIFFLAVVRGAEPRFGMLFEGFRRFGTALAALLLVTLFTFLWSLLLIVPGIIAAYSYKMTFYIIADNPDIRALDAIGHSKAMMKGFKWKLFCLQWRFFGWGLLCLLTFGLGFLWLAPYMAATMARFYDDVRGGAA